MITDLFVHLDGSDGDKDRLEAGRQIAVMFDAHLSGVFVNRLPDMPAAEIYSYSASALDDMQRQAREKGDRIAATLEGLLAGLDVRNELRRFDVLSSRRQQTFLAEARLYDLFVSTLPQEDDHETMALVESVLFGAGHSVLLVPPKCISALDFSTIVLGWRNTREAARAVDEALAIVGDCFAVKPGAPSVTTEVRVPRHLKVEVPRERLVQALVNLLQNAYEAIDEAGTVRVTAEVKAGLVVLKLADTGCGIHADEQQVIFFPGKSTKKGRLGTEHNTGWGLSLARKFVEEDCQGRISLQSERGAGTTITVVLPMERAEEDDDAR